MPTLLPEWFRARRPHMLDVLGPLIDLPPEAKEADYVVIPGVVPCGTTIPLHSHPERETIVIVAGRLEAWLTGSWRPYGMGDVIDIRPDAKHALRNDGPDQVATVLVTTARMARFFRQIGEPQSQDAGRPERLGHFGKVAAAYGFWNGSAEDQASIGIDLPTDEAVASKGRPSIVRDQSR